MTLVFDVGSNRGDKAAEMLARGARVVCFEPQPHCATILRERFAGRPDVVVVECALGSGSGTAAMSISDDADAISTLSSDWKTGRFRDFSWNRQVDVRVDTLDSAIRDFGVPTYCKIDVEGFEGEVISGLSHPLRLLSFEFTKEFEAKAVECIRRLGAIGFSRFNLSYGETHRFKLPVWVDADSLVAELPRVRSPYAWGDVFAATGTPSSTTLAMLPGPYTAMNDDTSLLALRRGGLSYPGVPLRLHLGCGESRFENYVNIDYPPSAHNVCNIPPDFVADITSLNFPDGSVDEIRLHHVFEHFNRVVALGLLIRWHRWLAHDGLLMIETPDFEATARAALDATGADRMSLIRHLEGDQAAAWGYHTSQWYPERFQRTLDELGFDVVSMEASSPERWHNPPLHNVTVLAARTKELPLDTLLERADALLWESTVADAERATWTVWCRQLREFVDSGTAPRSPIAHATLPSTPTTV